MKILKIFALFIVLHLAAWGTAHFYLSKNKPEILVVVDTSYAMKPKFSEMRDWIEDFESGANYKKLVIGTDKAMLGLLSELKSKDVIFRTAFGKMNVDSLNRYMGSTAKQKILLSDGRFSPEGWEVIKF